MADERVPVRDATIGRATGGTGEPLALRENLPATASLALRENLSAREAAPLR